MIISILCLCVFFFLRFSFQSPFHLSSGFIFFSYFLFLIHLTIFFSTFQISFLIFFYLCRLSVALLHFMILFFIFFFFQISARCLALFFMKEIAMRNIHIYSKFESETVRDHLRYCDIDTIQIGKNKSFHFQL